MELRYKLQQQQQSRWLGWVLLAVALAVWLPCAAAGKLVMGVVTKCRPPLTLMCACVLLWNTAISSWGAIRDST